MAGSPSFVFVLTIALLACGAGACSSRSVVTDLQIEMAIQQVKEQTDYEDMLDAAFDLEDMIREGDLRQVGPRGIDEIASMLDSDRDALRGWAAKSLSFFGPRAERAVPKLFEALRQVSCDPDRFGLHLDSEISIRESLETIGVTSIPAPDCDNQRTDSR